VARTPNIQKGLDGVMVDETAISRVVPETNSLTYRGYAVQDLCEHCCFEEVAYLLWNGELPTRSQLTKFRSDERARRELSRDHLAVIRKFPSITRRWCRARKWFARSGQRPMPSGIPTSC
jgi:citrate synthase